MKPGQTGLFEVSRGMYRSSDILRGVIVESDDDVLIVETEDGDIFKVNTSEFTLCYMCKGETK